LKDRTGELSRPDDRPASGVTSDPGEVANVEALVTSELSDVVLGATPDPGCGLWQEFWGRDPATDESRLLRVRLRTPGDHEVVGQVLQTARQVRAASHPSVLPLDRFGCTNQLLWLTFHAAPGGGLRDWLESGRAPSTSRAHEFLSLVAAPVMAMHADGWVHGALMPEAFHRGHDGRTRICCPWIDAQLVSADVARGVDLEALMCCAPEVREGFAPSRASDLYSVAALLVRVLCGRFPGPAGELPRGVVPGVWASALHRGLSPNPHGRFKGLEELLRALGPTSVVSSGPDRADADAVAQPRSRRPPGGVAAKPGQGPRLLFHANKGGPIGWSRPGSPRAVSRARRVWGALVLVALTVVLAAASGTTAEDLALAFSAAASTVEERLSRGAPSEAEAVARPAAAHDSTFGRASETRLLAAREPSDAGAAPPAVGEPHTLSVGPAVDAGGAATPAPLAVSPDLGASAGEDLPPATPAPETSAPGPPVPENPAPRSSMPSGPDRSSEAPPAEVLTTLAPARLSLQSYPWGSVYVDGAYVGTTPLLDLPIYAGAHIIRIERPDRLPYVRTVTAEPGQDLRLTGIVLDRGVR